VQVGRTSFQQVLLPNNRPWLPSFTGVGPGLSRSHLNSAVELGSFDPTLRLYATALTTLQLFRSGSYSSSLTHSLWSSTANFRATAMTARFLAFFPPRSASRSPHLRRSLSCPANNEGSVCPGRVNCDWCNADMKPVEESLRTSTMTEYLEQRRR
jgi:hypothetical protein